MSEILKLKLMNLNKRISLAKFHKRNLAGSDTNSISEFYIPIESEERLLLFRIIAKRNKLSRDVIRSHNIKALFPACLKLECEPRLRPTN